MADLTLHLKDRDIELSWEEFQELINKFSNNPPTREAPVPMPYYQPIYIEPSKPYTEFYPYRYYPYTWCNTSGNLTVTGAGVIDG